MEKNNTPRKTDSVDKKEEVQKSKDQHIDQDFENYPHQPAKENIVHPKTEDDLKLAGSGDTEEFNHVKPEEEKRNNDNDDIVHTGSGGAFEATEEVDHDDDEDELKKKRSDKNY
jgi:hypothetical protein